MTIIKVCNGSECTLKVEGSLDASTAPDLQAEVEALDGVKDLIFDFSRLVYISSAGLRVILIARNLLGPDGSVRIIRVKDTIRKILEITGFGTVVTIE